MFVLLPLGALSHTYVTWNLLLQTSWALCCTCCISSAWFWCTLALCTAPVHSVLNAKSLLAFNSNKQQER